MRIFVYGSLRRGFGNHSLLHDAKFIGDGWVPGFTMYSLGAYPMCTDGVGAVFAEAYEIDDKILSRLDALEGYPAFYNRKQVMAEISYPDSPSYLHFVRGWIYYGRQQLPKDRIVKTGKWGT